MSSKIHHVELVGRLSTGSHLFIPPLDFDLAKVGSAAHLVGLIRASGRDAAIVAHPDWKDSLLEDWDEELFIYPDNYAYTLKHRPDTTWLWGIGSPRQHSQELANLLLGMSTVQVLDWTGERRRTIADFVHHSVHLGGLTELSYAVSRELWPVHNWDDRYLGEALGAFIDRNPLCCRDAPLVHLFGQLRLPHREPREQPPLGELLRCDSWALYTYPKVSEQQKQGLRHHLLNLYIEESAPNLVVMISTGEQTWEVLTTHQELEDDLKCRSLLRKHFNRAPNGCDFVIEEARVVLDLLSQHQDEKEEVPPIEVVEATPEDEEAIDEDEGEGIETLAPDGDTESDESGEGASSDTAPEASEAPVEQKKPRAKKLELEAWPQRNYLGLHFSFECQDPQWEVERDQRLEAMREVDPKADDEDKEDEDEFSTHLEWDASLLIRRLQAIKRPPIRLTSKDLKSAHLPIIELATVDLKSHFDEELEAFDERQRLRLERLFEAEKVAQEKAREEAERERIAAEKRALAEAEAQLAQMALEAEQERLLEEAHRAALEEEERQRREEQKRQDHEEREKRERAEREALEQQAAEQARLEQEQEELRAQQQREAEERERLEAEQQQREEEQLRAEQEALQRQKEEEDQAKLQELLRLEEEEEQRRQAEVEEALRLESELDELENATSASDAIPDILEREEEGWAVESSKSEDEELLEHLEQLENDNYGRTPHHSSDAEDENHLDDSEGIENPSYDMFLDEDEDSDEEEATPLDPYGDEDDDDDEESDEEEVSQIAEMLSEPEDSAEESMDDESAELEAENTDDSLERADDEELLDAESILSRLTDSVDIIDDTGDIIDDEIDTEEISATESSDADAQNDTEPESVRDLQDSAEIEAEHAQQDNDRQESVRDLQDSAELKTEHAQQDNDRQESVRDLQDSAEIEAEHAQQDNDLQESVRDLQDSAEIEAEHSQQDDDLQESVSDLQDSAELETEHSQQDNDLQESVRDLQDSAELEAEHAQQDNDLQESDHDLQESAELEAEHSQQTDTQLRHGSPQPPVIGRRGPTGYINPYLWDHRNILQDVYDEVRQTPTLRRSDWPYIVVLIVGCVWVWLNDIPMI